MAQNYRNQSGRSQSERQGRYQTGGDQDRYRTGGEQRFNPEWDDRNRAGGGGFEGDRSYQAGGHSEEFGYRRGSHRDDQDRNWQGQHQQTRGGSGANYQSGRSHGGDFGNEGQSRFDEGRFDEGNRWSEGASDRDVDDNAYTRDRGTTTSSWHEDLGDRGGYFNTGSYIDDGDSWRGFGRDFERARQQVRRQYGSGGGGSERNYNSGDAGNYSRGYYGSQSGYGRNDDRQQRGQSWSGQQPSGRGGEQYSGSNFGSSRSEFGRSDFGRSGSSGNYEDRSSWNYGQEGRGQRAGSGSSGGAYGFDPSSNRWDFNPNQGSESQSHRGRGPQGYQRSDDRLKEIVCERLTDDPGIDASNVTVEVTGQIVKLTGTVDDRSTKYEIEELVERLGGVKDIDNQLRVQSRQSTWNQSSSNQSATTQQGRNGGEWEAGSSGTSASGSSTRSGSSTNASGGSTGSTGSTSGSTKRN